MAENYEAIARFLSACDAIIGGTYVNAKENITRALKALAASRDLCGLFDAMTQEFDYQSSKGYYLRGEEGKRGTAYFPAGRVDSLAFVFCLLVEIDSGKINLSEFLLRYFYVDGSYTASYSMFTEKYIRPFRDIVREAFPIPVQPIRAEGKPLAERGDGLGELLKRERSRLTLLEIPPEEIAAGDAILAYAQEAFQSGDTENLRAIMAGYSYFLRFFKAENSLTEEIFRLLGEI